jgi:hypothetical protein
MRINLLNIPVGFINLDRDIDRKISIQNQLRTLGFQKITRYRGELNTNAPVGLAYAEAKVLESASSPFLLLEDDVVASTFTNIIELPDDADGVYLGTSNWALQGKKTTHYLKYKKTDFHGIYKISNMMSAHAILYLSDEFLKSNLEACIKSQSPPFEPIDVHFARNQKKFNIYCVDAPLFVQKQFSTGMSDAPNWTNKRLTQYKRGIQIGHVNVPIPRLFN